MSLDSILLAHLWRTGSGQETITWNGEPSDNYPQVNLVQVRDITVTASGPAIASTRISGGSLIFSGSGGTADGTYFVLASTNIAIPLTSWAILSTHSFDASGNFTVTNTMNSNNTQCFYLLKE